MIIDHRQLIFFSSSAADLPERASLAEKWANSRSLRDACAVVPEPESVNLADAEELFKLTCTREIVWKFGDALSIDFLDFQNCKVRNKLRKVN